MKNASSPRYAFQRKTSVWNLFHTVVIVGAVSLPLLALAPDARAAAYDSSADRGIVQAVNH